MRQKRALFSLNDAADGNRVCRSSRRPVESDRTAIVEMEPGKASCCRSWAERGSWFSSNDSGGSLLIGRRFAEKPGCTRPSRRTVQCPRPRPARRKMEGGRERNHRRLAEAAERNGAAPIILPHPDDVTIDRTNGPKVIGMATPDDLARCEEAVAFCETLLMQNELDERSDVRHAGEPLDEPARACFSFIRSGERCRRE